MTLGVLTMLAVGTLVTLTSQFNASLGRRLGVLRATFNFMLTGAAASFVVAAFIGGWPVFQAWQLKPYHYLPGLLNVLTIATVLVLVNRQGAMMTTAGIFTGQVVTGLVLDSTGILGLPIIEITPYRGIAALLLVVGVAVVVAPTRAGRVTGTSPAGIRTLWLLIASIALGVVNGLLAAINADLGQVVGVFHAVFLFLAPGAVMLSVALAFRRFSTGQAATLDRALKPTHLIPGLMNVIVLGLSNIFMPITGLQVLVGAKFTANLFSAAVVDLLGWFGMPKYPLSARRAVGLGCLVPGVILSVIK